MSGKTLSIRGKELTATPDGEFIVSRRQIHGYDLRGMPQETRMFIDHPANGHGATVEVFFIDAPGPNGFEIKVNYRICPDCWKHSLAYSTFMDAVGERLHQAFSDGEDFAGFFNDKGDVWYTFTTTRPEHTVEDIEAAVTKEIDDALAQLIAYANQLDQQVKRQLGV